MRTVHHSFRNIFDNETFCTLYRKDNSTVNNIDFNQYIQENKLNNSLAINTKIVYTSVNKMSKVLLKSKWRPQSAVLMGSRRTTKIEHFLNDLDLVIHYDTDVTPFRRFGLDPNTKIEKI